MTEEKPKEEVESLAKRVENLGKEIPPERDVIRDAVRDEARGAAGEHVDFQGQPLLKVEYEVLKEIYAQTGKKPEEHFAHEIKEGSVVYLNCFDQGLTSLPGSIGRLVNLKKLNLEKNQLVALPDSIGNLRKLEGIYLGRNVLTSLPGSISELVNLTTLSLGDNKLTSLPYMRNFKKLKYFDMDYNQLTGALLESIGELACLEYLEAGHNRLTALP